MEETGKESAEKTKVLKELQKQQQVASDNVQKEIKSVF